MLPTTQEYKISLMIGQDSFRTLEGVEVIPNPNYPDEPWYSTGGLAIVFKLKLKDKLYALKCFYTEANERQERLGLIAAYLKQNPSPYFVDFTYLENELWVQTDNDEGQGYPVVLMEWVEGKTLDNYLEQICTQNNTPALKNLYFQFCNLAWWLQQQPIAHGDIKHDNLIVTPDGKLKLIDYDGVFVPALRGRKANEMGSPCYQHPKRDAYYFDKNLDDFSLLVLQITLLALQQHPKLFTEHYNGDGIIMKDTDYQNFSQSRIKTILWQLPEVKIPLLLSQLQGNLNNMNAIDLMPLLQDVDWINWLVGGQKDGKVELELDFEFVRQRLKELVLEDVKWRELFIDNISGSYSLNANLIEKHKNKWSWINLSSNGALPWSIELNAIGTNVDGDKRTLFDTNKIPFFKGKLVVKIFLVGLDFIKWDGEVKKNKNGLLFVSFVHKSGEVLPMYFSIELAKRHKEGDLVGQSFFKDLRIIWTDNSVFEPRLNLVSVGELTAWTFKWYEDKWDWDSLSGNESLPWSIELIEKYINKWSWNRLSRNESLPWSVELIEKYEDKWSWEKLSRNKFLPWSVELIEKYEDRWEWYWVSGNESLLWSIELIEKYENKWDWWGFSENKYLPWSIELIEKYENRWDWGLVGGGMSRNESLPWAHELIEKYENRWDWKYLSRNKSLPWTLELIEKYEKKWDWGCLSRNESLPWSNELIVKYEDKWEWKKIFGNAESLWSIELIEKYEDKWEWNWLSWDKNLPWSIELIEKYEKKLDWEKISQNPQLPWSIELIEKYKGKWDWFKFQQNIAIYEKVFQPLLNDEFIDEVMAAI